MASGADSAFDGGILALLLGLNRAGQRLYLGLFVLAVPALVAWTVILPRMRFSEQDEQLFRAARHGDKAALSQSLEAGASINVTSPIDGKTALFRAAVFGHAEVVRMLLQRGADVQRRGSDGLTVVETVAAARAEEKDPSVAHALDEVAAVLRSGGGHQ
jgi:hypothetical protein